MHANKLILIFDDQPIRRIWDAKKEKWFFSVVDIIAVLTDSSDPRKYWNKLAQRMREEGNESVTNCHQLKFLAKDGKKYLSDAADIEAILRLIQSVPSSKAEPFKLWLAKVGYERMQETVDPELAISRARGNWQTLGRSGKWIEQRMLGVETRNKLTDYWADHGIERPDEYALLTNVIHKEWSGLSVKDHKNLKGLNQHNLRDHMNEAELIFTALAELSTRSIAEKKQARGYNQNESAAKKGGKISGTARKNLEAETGKNIISPDNFLKRSTDINNLISE